MSMDFVKRLPRTVDARLLAALLALAAAPAASAHGLVEGTSAFFAGLVHPLTALEHVLPLLALGMLAGQRGLRSRDGLIIAFPIAFACSALVAPAIATLLDVSTAIAATALVLGILVALAFSLSTPVLYAVVAVAGGLHGLAHGGAIDHAFSSFVAGAALSATLLFAVAFGTTAYALRRQKPWLPFVVRAIGSWIAAFGVLAVALAFSSTTPIV